MGIKRGSISKRLGIETKGPLTKAICLEKVKKLKQGLKQNKYKGELLKYAKYYKNWYAWRATHKRAS